MFNNAFANLNQLDNNFLTFDFSLFENLLRRGAILSPQALFQILITLKLCHSIQNYFKNEKARTIKYPTLFQLACELKPQMDLLAKLNKSVDINGAISIIFNPISTILL